jgi:AraC-like DNA-binding protein
MNPFTIPAELATGMQVAYRQAPDGRTFQSGMNAYRSFSSGLMDLIVSDVVYQCDHELEIVGPKLLKIAFNECAALDLKFDEAPSSFKSHQECFVMMQPEGVRKRQRNYEHERVRCAQLIMRPEFFFDEVSFPPEQLPETFWSFIKGEESLRLARIPMSASLRRCVAEVMSVDQADPFAPMLLEGKSFEMLYHFFRAWNSNPSVPSDAPSRSKDRFRLQEIKRLLDREFASPRSLNELARMAGMSRSRLAVAFKAEFGMSVGDYCLNRRMMTARQLIVTGDDPLGIIAYKVGYEHQSSFNAAYRQFFGVTPNAHRLA